MRSEHDSMGAVEVPTDALWQAQTQRALAMSVSDERLDPVVVRALGLVKAEAARMNASLGVVDGPTAAAIIEAAERVAAGEHPEAFPVPVFQTGSGTSSNMNVNEVLATLASRSLGRHVHPNDDVNASQSSNDVFPTAIRIAVALEVVAELSPSLACLRSGLRSKAEAWATVVKVGRTHLMDATPVTLGQEFGGYAAQLAECEERLADTLVRVCRLPLGGTATGTGLNAPAGFAVGVIERLATRTNLALVEAPDHFAAQAAQDALVELSGQLRVLGLVLHKIAGDVRWMGSGPAAGLAEVRLPALQPGSSIMGGKTNPVVPEVVIQVVAQVIGNDAAIAFAASNGQFELLAATPILSRALLESVRLIARACTVLWADCIEGIEPDIERLRSLALASGSSSAALNRRLGYDLAADVTKEATAAGRSIRAEVIRRNLLTEQEADDLLDPVRLAWPAEGFRQRD